MALLTSHFRYSSSLLSFHSTRSLLSGVKMNNTRRMDSVLKSVLSSSIAPSDSTPKTIDAHLHIWASPVEAASGYPYHPGQEPALDGSSQFLLQCMGEAEVDGALIVQPINHMFDHSLVTSVLKKHPTKFAGCCLANPAEDGSGIHQLEHLVLKDGYRAVRFNPYLWPSGQKMTNKVGSALFSKAGELGIPVGIMCMKGLALHLSEIEELCSNFPSTVVILDHLGFCKPSLNSDDDEESDNLSALLKLSVFPQIYVKFSALFRLSRKSFPYEDISSLLSEVISSYGSNHIMWGSDFPFVVPECGYKGAKESANFIASKIQLSISDLESIMGRTASQLFRDSWRSQ